ncbi:MAG TPA: hypothetical protein VFZ65_16865 [Planctomycetota bacterium]|nr:hypothetical protein [Planctomycetota bacterium]
MAKPPKLLIVAVLLVAVGYGGLTLGERLHPGSNLLGGWALVCGPVLWLGLLLLFVALVRLFVRWVGRSADGEARRER